LSEADYAVAKRLSVLFPKIIIEVRAVAYSEIAYSNFYLNGELMMKKNNVSMFVPIANQERVNEMLFYRIIAFVFLTASTPALSGWITGQARADITGPVFGTATMGYAVPTPVGRGLQQRLYARAFFLEDERKKQVFLIHVDTCFVTLALKERVVRNLRSSLPDAGIDSTNVMIMASHTHSGPGGYSHHFYYNASTKGMVVENFEALQNGITKAAMQAYASRSPATVTWQRSMLFGGAKNRSIEPFLQNPENERREIAQETDPTFDQLQFYHPGGEIKGVLNWFAVHGTSIKKDNKLISGDNKGYAQYWLEKELGAKKPDFVAAFANANGGDASPGLAGDTNGDRSWECAENKNKACAEKLGLMQAQKAKTLTDKRGEALDPVIHARHRFVDFSDVSVDGTKTCKAAVGVSMLAGTIEDGHGVGEEGVTCSIGSGAVVTRGCAPKFACHGEKPVVVQSGVVGWHPNVLPVQLVRLGQIAIAAVPAEFTTMAGHRLRRQLEASLQPYGVNAVIFAGYANGYSSYVTTEEEYALQHYEGASTLYGPKTLKAYQQVFGEITADFSAPNPPETFAPERQTPNRITGANLTRAPRRFQRQVARGANVGFRVYANNPNFSVLAERNMFLVEAHSELGWQTYLDESDWNTELQYKRGRASLRWSIGSDIPSGLYRLTYVGCYQFSCLDEFRTSSSGFHVL